MARHLLRMVPDMVDDTPRSAPRARSRWGRGHLVLCMLLAIGTVTGLAWWDSRRESEAVLRDVGREQATVAAIVALDLRTHLEDAERDMPRLPGHSAVHRRARVATEGRRCANLNHRGARRATPRPSCSASWSIDASST